MKNDTDNCASSLSCTLLIVRTRPLHFKKSSTQNSTGLLNADPYFDRVVDGVGYEYRFGKQLVAASRLQVLESFDSERGRSIVHDVIHA